MHIFSTWAGAIAQFPADPFGANGRGQPAASERSVVMDEISRLRKR